MSTLYSIFFSSRSQDAQPFAQPVEPSSPKPTPSLDLPNLFQNFSCLISEAMQGILETHEGLEKAVYYAKISFATFFLGTAITSYAFSATPLILGAGSLGMVASAIYGYYHHRQIEGVAFWKKGFEMIFQEKVDEGVDFLKGALTKSHTETDYPIEKFQKKYYEGFSYLDVRSRKADCSSYMIVPVFGNLLLYRAILLLKDTAPVSKEKFAILQKDVTLATILFQNQRCSIQKDQKTVCDLFQKSLVEVQSTLQQGRIPIPKQVSVGHGLLLEIYICGLPNGDDALKNQKVSVQKAKLWLEKSDQFKDGSLEKQVVEGLLAAKNKIFSTLLSRLRSLL